MTTKYKLALFLHLAVGVIIFSSPFWVDWRIIALGVVAFFVQHFAYGKCLLTVMQFNNKDVSFGHFYLNKLGFKFKRKNVDFVITYVIPIFILGLALQIQHKK